MTGIQKISEIVLFLLTAAVLLTFAQHSESFIRKGTAGKKANEIPIERNERLYGIDRIGVKTLWAAGNFGKIIRSDDGGETWVVQHTKYTENLQDIAAWDSERAVAVGGEGIVIITDDGGLSWQKVSVPLSEEVNKLLKVKIYDNGKAWAVGIMGMILYSDDWGKSWKRGIEEDDVAWNDIFFMNEEKAIVVGEFGRILRTEDGGKTWTDVKSPVDSSLMSVFFKDTDSGVAAGLGGVILETYDGGHTWTKVENSGTTEHLFKVGFWNNEWFCTGNKGILVVGSADGEHWQAKRLSEREFMWHTDASAIGSRLYFVGGSQGFLEKGEWSYIQ